MAGRSLEERVEANLGPRYIETVLRAFRDDPPTNDYQRGYLAALAEFGAFASLTELPGFAMTPELARRMNEIAPLVETPGPVLTEAQAKAVSPLGVGI